MRRSPSIRPTVRASARIRRVRPRLAAVAAAALLLVAPAPRAWAQAGPQETMTADSALLSAADPNPTQLFFAATARTPRAGGGYAGAGALLLPFAGVAVPYVGFAVADRLTVSGGAGLAGGEGSIGQGYVGAKAQLLRGRDEQLAVGGVAFLGGEGRGHSGLAYGVATFGNADGALTVGATWEWYSGHGYSDLSDRPVVMVGGEARLAPHAKLLSENYVIPGSGGLAGVQGVRIFGTSVSADVGLAGVLGLETAACCYPVVNVTYAFGPSPARPAPSAALAGVPRRR